MTDASTHRRKRSRRTLLKVLGATAASAVATVAGKSAAEPKEKTESEGFWSFFRTHYKEMSRGEIDAMLQRLERKYSKRYGREVEVDDTPARDGVLYGYALSLDRCKGYRDCVHACAEENNLSRSPEAQYIRVLEIDRGEVRIAGAKHDYDPETVPQPGKWYLPVQCFQCDNPPCVQACPVDATWMEPDGIVVVDYDHCIGCRYCMTACPYWARRFNWTEPEVPAEELNTNTHYLGNRPRPAGVVEKCSYCIQRTRDGRQPACQEACPTGARVFGNLLDPDSEIRYVLENKTVFRLKEELSTEPKFWYFVG
ncbi:MAG: 4Fe-4S dicluster domain-containing protein [Myxococcales bacterium]|jgi:molybdopterin-containing oxidoreductase family iron-sulfur binding subunit